MKKVVCPRCDNFLRFDETKYDNVKVIHFICQHCGRKFGIRLGTKEADASDVTREGEEQCGHISIIENQFCYKQEFPLYLGDNLIGRRSKGTEVQIPILTSDMSMDRKHCIINIKKDKEGKLIYTLRDFPSLTGTFLYNEILSDKERVVLSVETIVTIGATTFIVYMKEQE